MPVTPEQAAAVDAEFAQQVELHAVAERVEIADLRAFGNQVTADRREVRLMSVEDAARNL
jgi:hypothetical protein